jgi:hypothetical protein
MFVDKDMSRLEQYLRIHPEMNRDTVLKRRAGTFAVPNEEYVPLTVEVLDVRYPVDDNQRDMINTNILYRIRIPDGHETDEDYDLTKLTDILYFLKKRCNFKYVFIVQTSCRSNEFGPEPAGEPRDLIAMMHDTYRRQRSDRRKMVVRNNISRLGGRRPPPSRPANVS